MFYVSQLFVILVRCKKGLAIQVLTLPFDFNATVNTKFIFDFCVLFNSFLNVFRALKLKEVCSHRQFSKHPNIVTLHEAWEEDRYFYLQMELCKKNLVVSEPVPESQCWEILADITSVSEHINFSMFGGLLISSCRYDELWCLSITSWDLGSTLITFESLFSTPNV